MTIGKSKPSLFGKLVTPPLTQAEVTHMRELQEVKKESHESFKRDVSGVQNVKFKIESDLASACNLLRD